MNSTLDARSMAVQIIACVKLTKFERAGQKGQLISAALIPTLDFK